ncbi:hypothetical protein M8C21_007244, partial [Ambrosia artemisiifolia]
KNVLRWEGGNKRKLAVPEGVENGKVVEFRDLWLNGSDSLPFKSAFKNVIFRKSSSLAIEKPLGVIHNKLDQDDSVIVQFKICCPNIAEGTSIYVIGSSVELGKWKVHDGLKLSYAGESVWEGDCVVPKAAFPLKYKYCKYGKNGNFSLEYGSNREVTVDISAIGPNYVILSDGMMREMPWRGAGVAIPMFSVRSEDDVGVGEFVDLKLVVDWAVNSGFHLLQLLPINDTSVHKMWWDSYPYSSLSVFALHPLYLRLQRLSDNIPDDINQEIQRAKKELDGKNVDYDATMNTKLSIAKKIFDLEKDLILNSDSFKNFLSKNEEWLKPYAAFCFLRDFFETSDHSQWGTFSQFSKDKLEKLVSKDSFHYDIICFHYYIQYHLHLQLSEAAEYAKEKGVVLKGDLPIGVDKNSVDTWMANYFTAYRIDHILGFFRIWELPAHAMTGLVGKFRPSIPLNQEELEKEGIWDFDRLSKPYIRQEFLQEKFGPLWTVIASYFMNEFKKNHYEFKDDCNTEKKIAAKLKSLIEKKLLLENEDKLRRELFDLVQNIVLIRDPEDAKSFYPRFNLEDTSSFKDLDENRDSLAPKCHEDFACASKFLRYVMQELGLIGLRIQRMPSEADLEFGIPSQYDYMTVCAPSCHDCSTLRAWWEEDEDRRRSFFKTMVGSDSLPPEKCVPEIHVESPSMWAIFPLQDLLALKDEYTTRPATEETINDPTNPKHYWRFRVHVTMESLLKDTDLTTMIKGLVCASARSYPGQEEAQSGVAVVPPKQQIAGEQEKIRLPNQDPKITSIAVLLSEIRDVDLAIDICNLVVYANAQTNARHVTANLLWKDDSSERFS